MTYIKVTKRVNTWCHQVNNTRHVMDKAFRDIMIKSVHVHVAHALVRYLRCSAYIFPVHPAFLHLDSSIMQSLMPNCPRYLHCKAYNVFVCVHVLDLLCRARAIITLSAFSLSLFILFPSSHPRCPRYCQINCRKRRARGQRKYDCQGKGIKLLHNNPDEMIITSHV